MDNIAKFLVVWMMAASPVYLFESGNPQPSDFVAVIFVVFVVTGGMAVRGWRYPVYGMPLWHLLLVFWVTLVNISWAIILSSEALLRPSFFFLYNFMVASSIILCLRHVRKFQEWLTFAIMAGLIVSGTGALYSLGAHIRPTGFFNNPNQLGYYSLLGLCALIVATDFRVKATPIFLLAIMGGVIGIVAAGSLGAWGGLGLLASAFFFNLVKSKGRGVMIACFLVVATGLVVEGANLYSDGAIAETIEARINRADHKFESLYQERKYNRIAYNLEYTFLGAGEGEYEKRFYPYVSTEIHSSIGTLIFAYGGIGLLLFFAIVLSALWRAPLPVWIVVSAPMAYSVSHMGLRTTLLWVLLAIVWFKYRESRQVQLLSKLGRKRVKCLGPLPLVRI